VSKTVLLIDDEQGFLEPLEDALISEGHHVMKAFTGEEALRVLSRQHVDLVTLDVMLPPGPGLEEETSSLRTGVYIAKKLVKLYPNLDIFCLSVVNDEETIREIQELGIRFLRKGETPLRTVLNMIRSCLTGIAYSTERDSDRWSR
jgi:DNA-binding NarL/FixJ family response regulator